MGENSTKKTIPFYLREGETYIPLIQLLKIVGIAESGAHAQQMVLDGIVTRNGEVELRKRAKITNGETIEIDNQQVVVKTNG